MTSYAVLLVLCAVTTLCAAWSVRICAIVLVINFLLNESVVRLTGDYSPWLWFLATDTASLLILTAPFAGRIGAILAATYATQIVMHLSFGISKSGEPYTYWQSLTAMAWLQLLILFAGSMTHGCRRIGIRLRGRVPFTVSAYHKSVRKARGESE